VRRIATWWYVASDVTVKYGSMTVVLRLSPSQTHSSSSSSSGSVAPISQRSGVSRRPRCAGARLPLLLLLRQRATDMRVNHLLAQLSSALAWPGLARMYVMHVVYLSSSLFAVVHESSSSVKWSVRACREMLGTV